MHEQPGGMRVMHQAGPTAEAAIIAKQDDGAGIGADDVDVTGGLRQPLRSSMERCS